MKEFAQVQDSRQAAVSFLVSSLTKCRLFLFLVLHDHLCVQHGMTFEQHNLTDGIC